MSTVDALLSRYISEHRSIGDADPLPYLEELRGTDRAELAALIDDYLAHAPPRAYDLEAFARFRADPSRQAMVERILDDTTLVSLRKEAGVTKVGAGDALARALGLAGHEQRVKARYHEIETGLIDPDRVRPRVWEVLADALGASVDRVRSAAAGAFAARPGGAPGVSFARTAEEDASLAVAAASAPLAAGDDDVVDRALFED
jgi:hypothetical protein